MSEDTIYKYAPYTKAFVGIFSTDDNLCISKNLVSELFGLKAVELKRSFSVVHTFGNTKTTVKFKINKNHLCCLKGRPYLLNKRNHLKIVTKFTKEHLKKIYGKFSIFFSNDEEILLATDLLGTGSIFYYQINDKELIFSSHLGSSSILNSS